MHVLSEVEIKARQEVELEAYVFKIQIEGRMYNELVYNYIIPSAISYQNKLIKNVSGLKEIYGAAHQKFAEGQLNIIESIAEHIMAIKLKTDDMTKARKRANGLSGINKKAMAYCENVMPYFEGIREHADKLEGLIEDETWPLAKYRELLFSL